MFGRIGELASLLKQAPELMRQAQQMQARAAEIQERLKELRVEGSAGGGMVTVQANGQQRVLSVKIDPTLFAGGDAEMVEDLLVAAVNQAVDKAKEAAAEQMQSLTENLDMPGMQDMLAKFGLHGGDGNDNSSSGGKPV